MRVLLKIGGYALTVLMLIDIAPLAAEPAPLASSVSLAKEGAAHLKAGNLTQAEALFRQAVNTDTSNHFATVSLAKIYLSQARADQALELLAGVPSNLPLEKSATFFAIQGDAYEQLSQHSKAQESYEKAIKLEPHFEDLYPKLGLLYSLQGEDERAQEMFHRAVQTAPRDATLWTTYAGVLLRNKKYAEAVPAAKKAISLKKASAAYTILGMAYEGEKNFDQAIIAFRRAIDLGDTAEETKSRLENVRRAAQQ